MAKADSAQRARQYEVTIERWALYRVIEMPGLTRIDLRPRLATLTFETAPGCEPAGLEFVSAEVQRISGGNAIAAREVSDAA